MTQQLDTPAAVDVRGLAKVFGVMPALVGVDLVVPQATICGLAGGNGAGKTTLLRCVATLLRPTVGQVLVLGRDAQTEASRVRWLIDFLPAAGGAYPDLSGAENLRYSLSMRGIEHSREMILAAMRHAGLEEAADDLSSTYSTGMLRRLALARLALTRPPVLLLDEPYATLDEPGRELVDELLAEARAERRSALVATHDVSRLDGLADSVVRIDRGAMETRSATPAGAHA